MNNNENNSIYESAMETIRRAKKCKPKCIAIIGPTGPTGPTGPSGGPTGATGATGGMEDISENQPTGWTFTNPDGVASSDALGSVHSGEQSVTIENESAIEQTIPIDGNECFYRLSFFAQGEGAQVGFTATVTFITPTGDVAGGEIVVRQQDLVDSNRNFTFFQLITSQAPADATSINIRFLVDSEGEQSLILDDISLTKA